VARKMYLTAVTLVLLVALGWALVPMAREATGGGTKASAAAPAPLAGLGKEVADTFPGLAEAVLPGAQFREATRTSGGTVAHGWDAVSSLPNCPEGLLAVEREAWLAAAVRDHGSAPVALRAFFPSSYDDPFVVEGDGIRAAVRAIGAFRAPASDDGGRMVYRGAFPLTDSLHVVLGDRTEEFLLLRNEGAPVRFQYEIVESAGAEQIFLHEGAVRFLGSNGRGLEIPRPFVVDADGRRSDSAARWELGPPRASGTRRLTLTLDPRGLSYPLAIDPGWSTVGALSQVRLLHTATLLPTGKVLVAGGYTGSITNTAELYDPATGLWSATGALSAGRYLHTAVVLPSGKVLVAGGYGSGGSISSCELYTPSTGLWTPAGSLAEARYAHTATLLSSGKVLAAGGYGVGGTLGSCELFDPTANAGAGGWTSTGAMASGHYFHMAALLGDGKVLAAGGLDAGNAFTDVAEVYDPAGNAGAGSWTTTGTLTTPRGCGTATVLATGKVLLAGGFSWSGYLSSSEVYDPAMGTFVASAGAMATARYLHSATLLPNGRVFILGGYGVSGPLSSGEVYEQSMGLWGPAASLDFQRARHTATLLPSGRILIAGGEGDTGLLSSTLVYDPTMPAFEATGTLSAGRYYHTGTLLPNGKVLAAGGFGVGGYLSSAESYDPSSGNWGSAGTMTAARWLHAATLMNNGKVLVTGGYAGSYLSSAEVFDPAGSGSWSSAGTMAESRYLHTSTLLPGGKILIAGGYNGSYLTGAELYDPLAGVWNSTGPLAEGRIFHSATLLPNGKVLVTGGITPSGYVDTAELYDPATGQWTSAGTMVYARGMHRTTLLPNGKVLISGGTNSTGFQRTAELYDPGMGTFTATGSMATARYVHQSVLLQDGTVLVAGGGNGGGYLSSAELYDPATGTWSDRGTMAAARDRFTATLLPSGKILIAGGFNNAAYMSACEIFDPGLGFSDLWRPTVGSVTNPALYGSVVTASGTLFRGLGTNGPEASGGSSQSSPTNYPLLQLYRLDNAQTLFLPLDPSSGYSGTSFVSTTAWTFHPGPALATIFTNGIPSSSAYTLITGPVPANPAPPSFTSVSCTSLTVNWTAVSGATSYDVWRTPGAICAGATKITGSPVAGTSYPVSGLSAGTQYSFYVTANNGFGVSDNGDCATVTTSPGTPVAPTGVAASTDRCTDVRVSWSASAGASSYNVIRGTSCGTAVTTFTGVTSPYDDTTAVAGDSYQYWVVAVNGCGTSSNSSCAAGIKPLSCAGWTPSGALGKARYHHTATKLQSGKVLVVGGSSGNNIYESSAEIYDPGTGMWTDTGSMAAQRYIHTATLLDNGKVLVTGGYNNGGYVATAELFDPAANGGIGGFTATGSMSAARGGHTASKLSNGKVLIAGGYNAGGYLNTAELFDPAGNAGAGSFSSAGTMADARYMHCAEVLASGKVLVAGGLTTGNTFLRSAELYDISTGWSSTGDMVSTRGVYTSALLASGKVLVAGGFGVSGFLNTAEIFDPAGNSGAGSWASTGSMNVAQYLRTATVLQNGKVLVAGGHDATGPVAGTELYDPNTGLWDATQDLSSPRAGHTATILNDGKVLVVGGDSGTGYLLSSTALYF
jgi:N-acetylneuraminic acid mutarotase